MPQVKRITDQTHPNEDRSGHNPAVDPRGLVRTDEHQGTQCRQERPSVGRIRLARDDPEPRDNACQTRNRYEVPQ